jgi:osmotically-inducible protein OsmY
LNDIALSRDVMDELKFEPSLDATHIGVVIEKDVVILTRHVKTCMEKVRAEEAVRHVRGVYGIAQELGVRRPSDKKNSDDEIARRARDILHWGTIIPHGKIQVQVERGWVTLSGEVDWYYQRMTAESAIHWLCGIAGISNLLTIKPQVQVSDIKTRIENALTRKAQASEIHVSVAGNKVLLDAAYNPGLSGWRLKMPHGQRLV